MVAAVVASLRTVQSIHRAGFHCGSSAMQQHLQRMPLARVKCE